jgi:hypothetical protein
LQRPLWLFLPTGKAPQMPISTRVVCLDCTSLPHSIGKWLDHQLQPIVQCQQIYFKNLVKLEDLFETMNIHPNNACLFTYNAVLMYTSIDTTQCINRLTSFLNDDPTTITQYLLIQPKALIDAHHLVMHNNWIKFGNLFVHQHKGIVMGMVPAPSIANLLVDIYEETHTNPFPSSSLHFLHCFIDNGFGIWL